MCQDRVKNDPVCDYLVTCRLNRQLTFSGVRLTGSDLTKTTATQDKNPSSLFVTGSGRTAKTVDSLDLENFLHPK